MKLLLVAVGQRQPGWADEAYAEFAKRFPPEMRLELKAVKAEPRGAKTAEQLMAAEAARMTTWLHDGRDVALLIGGPDGLDASLKASADETLRLSELTLPHAFARVLLAEALYRAWTVTVNHPYHRE